MQNYFCKTCGAKLYWNIADQCLKCDYCDSEYQVSDFEDDTLKESVAEPEQLDSEYVHSNHDTAEMVVYECSNCKGEVVALKTTMSTICPYCGEAISITSKAVGEFRPQYCIPFKKNKEEIMEIYKKYVNSSFLTPKEFKDNNVIEKIQGLFVPFHLHSLEHYAKHTFEGEKLKSFKRGYDKVTIHELYHLKLDAHGKFKRIPTDGALKLDNDMMDAIAPFNYSECVAYNPAYMAGFFAEQTDDDKEKMDERAEKMATDAMRNQAESQFVGFVGLRRIGETIDISNHTSEYVLLPIWLLHVAHGAQKYTFAINGQTGKIVGKLPMDKLKLCTTSLAAFAAADIATALIMLFV